jgi:endo-alpha-1,4-polygalactosaminidase (GH114 family)
MHVAEVERLQRINAARSWGYQLSDIKLEELARAPYDLLVVDATTGLATGRHFGVNEVDRLKSKPDGARFSTASMPTKKSASDAQMQSAEWSILLCAWPHTREKRTRISWS